MDFGDILMSKAERAMMQRITHSKHTILLLGNGFDLACGYRTAYRDFYTSGQFAKLVNEEDSCLAQFIKHKNMELNDRERRWADLEEILWEYAQLVYDLQASEGDSLAGAFDLDDEMVCGYKSLSMFEHRVWWALNDKAKAVLRLLDYELEDDDLEHFKMEYRQLRNAICSYLDGEVNEESRITERADTKRMYNLVNRWIETSERCTALMFNYTTTLKDMLDDLDMVADCRVRYLHGECAYGGEGIVVGIDDGMRVDKRYSFLEKSENEACLRYSYIKDIEGADRYVIFGSTVGRTDDWYYKSLFQQKESKVYEIYYYGKQEKLAICDRIEELSGMDMEDFCKKHVLVMVNSQLPEGKRGEDVFIDERKREYKDYVEKAAPEQEVSGQ